MTLCIEPRCIADKNCPMTAGYYIGGGQYICWLHAMTVPGCLEAVSDQQMCALKGDTGQPEKTR